MNKLFRVLFTGSAMVICIAVAAQPSMGPPSRYWQQECHYDITVSLEDKEHALQGIEQLQYSNNSPDTLHFIYIHCWPNGYKDTTTALYRQLEQLQEKKGILQQPANRGYMDQLDFTVDGVKAVANPHPQFADIVQLQLPAPLPPGGSVKIRTPFHVKIPAYFSRLGHQGRFYMITQWYPKPAVYDSAGWHEMPYLDQGEFYSEYGSFDVHITLPANFVVAATGKLLTQNELSIYKSLGTANLANPSFPRSYREFIRSMPSSGSQAVIPQQSVTAPPSSGSPAVIPQQATPAHLSSPGNSRSATKTLDYHADSVHDFGWFCNPDLIINYDTLQLPSGKIIDAFSWFRPDGNKEWRHSIGFIKDATLHYSRWVGEYAYPVVNAVEGPGNTSSGGMEYPMITLITSPKASREELDGVITHEVGHNWFYAMLGSNERDAPWMDEGINTFYEFRYTAEKYRSNTMLGSMIPPAMKHKTSEEFQDALYDVIAQVRAPEPIATPAADFPSEFDYGLVVYAHTAVWLHKVEKYMGTDDFEKGMQNYFARWKFKHPSENDLKTSLESVSHENLQKLFKQIHGTEPL